MLKLNRLFEIRAIDFQPPLVFILPVISRRPHGNTSLIFANTSVSWRIILSISAQKQTKKTNTLFISTTVGVSHAQPKNIYSKMHPRTSLLVFLAIASTFSSNVMAQSHSSSPTSTSGSYGNEVETEPIVIEVDDPKGERKTYYAKEQDHPPESGAGLSEGHGHLKPDHTYPLSTSEPDSEQSSHIHSKHYSSANDEAEAHESYGHHPTNLGAEDYNGQTASDADYSNASPTYREEGGASEPQLHT